MKFFCKIILAAAIFFSSVFGYSQTKENPASRIKESVEVLASDRMEGREPGTREDKEAAKYIAGVLKNFGFVPLVGDSPLVPFEFTLYREVGFGSFLKIESHSLTEWKEWALHPQSVAADINAKLAVYEPSPKADFYKGKIVYLMSPADSIPFKASEMKDSGAVAIIVASGSIDNLERRGGVNSYSLPVFMIAPQTESLMAESAGKSLHLKSVVHPVKGHTYNVLMHLNRSKGGKSVLIGAHYDHLGMGGPGSGSVTPKLKEVHNGADDNASGVAVAAEVGRLLAQKGGDLGFNVIVAAFGAEERGLIGSRRVADTLAALKLLPGLMINLDMVGRLKEERLQVGGVGTFTGADKLAEDVNKKFGFTLSLTKDGYGPSDHASFYTAGVPVLYFTTGVHKQYHTPYDDIELINFEGMEKISSYIAAILDSMNTEGFNPQYQKVAQPATMGRASFKVTLGVIPDFTYEKGDGFRVGSVTDGKPANKAGMMAGDIITSMNGKKVTNIYDYMARLGELKAGEKVEVDAVRDGKEIKLTIEL